MPGQRVVLGQGQVEGVDRRSFRGREYAAFMGIPYGAAKRFQLPQPAPKWEGVLKADKRIECLQRNLFLGGASKGREEGGLVLNVYVAKDVLAKTEATVPTMVFIHGGGFALGSGTEGIVTLVSFVISK